MLRSSNNKVGTRSGNAFPRTHSFKLHLEDTHNLFGFEGLPTRLTGRNVTMSSELPACGSSEPLFCSFNLWRERRFHSAADSLSGFCGLPGLALLLNLPIMITISKIEMKTVANTSYNYQKYCDADLINISSIYPQVFQNL